MKPHLLDRVRAALWALRTVRSARRQLRAGTPVDELRLRALPDLPVEAAGGVRRVVRGLDGTCLERAVVLQRWHAAHGDPRALLIGVTTPSSGFRAHAWLEGEEPGEAEFTTLARYEAP
ncbi:MAG: lasso peptide biosynthesis B2 protein [Actinomycetota bacterium]